jgi:hypothetical protein
MLTKQINPEHKQKLKTFLNLYNRQMINTYGNPQETAKHFIRQIKHEIHSYNTKSKDSTKYFRLLSNETDDFLYSYKTIQTKKEKEQALIKDKNLTSPFLDLINAYSIKGYKIPDLSYKHNLFTPSILTSEPSKVIPHFKNDKKNKNKDFRDCKDMKFIKKLNTLIKYNKLKVAKGDEHKGKRYKYLKEMFGFIPHLRDLIYEHQKHLELNEEIGVHNTETSHPIDTISYMSTIQNEDSHFQSINDNDNNNHNSHNNNNERSSVCKRLIPKHNRCSLTNSNQMNTFHANTIKISNYVENENKSLRNYNKSIEDCISSFEQDSEFYQTTRNRFPIKGLLLQNSSKKINSPSISRTCTNKTVKNIYFPNVTATQTKNPFTTNNNTNSIQTTPYKNNNIFQRKQSHQIYKQDSTLHYISPNIQTTKLTYNNISSIKKTKLCKEFTLGKTEIKSKPNLHINIESMNDSFKSVSHDKDIPPSNKKVSFAQLNISNSKDKGNNTLSQSTCSKNKKIEVSSFDDYSQNDPAEFFKLIQKTKKQVLTYDFDKMRNIAMNCKKTKHEGKKLVDKIISTDKILVNMDKKFIKSIEFNN